MPKTTASPPKYRHFKPKDLAVVRIDGRDVYLGKYGSSESWERYARVIAEWRYPSGKPHLFSGRVSPDDGTTRVPIAEERPWRGSGGRRRSGRR
ncbi:hypothetical protein SAMN05444166_3419 [Singulisphaera sp. GP187]|uniref:hypothetical protein n=1 Tax=Singulisphaera sp. GP187 TaxID=1882752 RepID=UPI000926FD40|nr:hypothetical protein [Singulisphaera sp. GP187]SIO27745.1 hypothetical protein SAMN05444166_3419 [Singulisphaera sp. GP187]